MRNTPEHNEQVAFFQMCEMFAKQDSRFSDIYAIPNGGLRDVITASKLKDEGVKAGVLDVFCFVPSGQFHGLYLEFKSKRGQMTEKQTNFATRAVRRGYAVAVVREAEQAIRFCKKYFNRPEELWTQLNSKS